MARWSLLCRSLAHAAQSSGSPASGMLLKKSIFTNYFFIETICQPLDCTLSSINIYIYSFMLNMNHWGEAQSYFFFTNSPRDLTFVCTLTFEKFSLAIVLQQVVNHLVANKDSVLILNFNIYNLLRH